MAISTVIFDMGGVLVWTHWERATEPLAELSGKSPDQVLDALCNTDAHFAYMCGDIDAHEFACSAMASLGIELPSDEILRIWDSILAPNPDALAVLERVKGRHRLVLGSNTDPGHYQRSVEVQPALGLFDDHLLSYELGVNKPDPAFFSLGLERIGLSPQECVFIDDLAENVESAQGLGITGIRFESMAQVESELERMGLV